MDSIFRRLSEEVQTFSRSQSSGQASMSARTLPFAPSLERAHRLLSRAFGVSQGDEGIQQ